MSEKFRPVRRRFKTLPLQDKIERNEQRTNI